MTPERSGSGYASYADSDEVNSHVARMEARRHEQRYRLRDAVKGLSRDGLISASDFGWFGSGVSSVVKSLLIPAEDNSCP